MINIFLKIILRKNDWKIVRFYNKFKIYHCRRKKCIHNLLSECSCSSAKIWAIFFLKCIHLSKCNYRKENFFFLLPYLAHMWKTQKKSWKIAFETFEEKWWGKSELMGKIRRNLNFYSNKIKIQNPWHTQAIF